MKNNYGSHLVFRTRQNLWQACFVDISSMCQFGENILIRYEKTYGWMDTQTIGHWRPGHWMAAVLWFTQFAEQKQL